MAELGQARGLRYEAEVDERWMRVWEPYTTLKIPVRYEHALSTTGAIGSLTIARMVQLREEIRGAQPTIFELGAWIAIAQDERIRGKVAASNEAKSPFAESPELVETSRHRTGDAAFDAVFAAFGTSREAVAEAIGPSVRKLVLGWRVPLHFEIRHGGFVLAPVALGRDPRSLGWLVDAVHWFGDKAAKAVAR